MKVETAPASAGFRTVYEDDTLRIADAAAEKSGDAAENHVVSFTGIGLALGWGLEAVQSEEFRKTLADATVGRATYVIDKQRSWYNSTWEAIAAQLGPLCATSKRVTTLGNSMGGFGAFYLASAIPNCARAIAFAPQFSVHPELMPPREDRWSKFRDAIQNHQRRHALDHPSDDVDYVAFFGEDSEQDRGHSHRLARVATQRTFIFIVGGCEHDVAAAIKRAGVMVQLLDLLLAPGPFRPGAVVRLLAEGGLAARRLATAHDRARRGMRNAEAAAASTGPQPGSPVATDGKQPDGGAGVRTLDFIVLGVARSGTSAVARAIDCDPGCFCAHEFFHDHFDRDFSKVAVPDAFFANAGNLAGKKMVAASVANLRGKLAAGPVVAIGDKVPRFFLSMEKMYAELPGLRSIHIHRDAGGMADSWDRRAVNPNDKRWPEGRSGYFGILEWIISLARIVEMRVDIRLVDYASLFYEDPGIYSKLIHYISGRDPDQATIDRFMKSDFRGASGLKHKTGTSRYDGVLAEIGSARLDALLHAHPFCGTDDIRHEIGQFIDGSWDRIFAYVVDTLGKSGTDAERGFALTWAVMVAERFDNAGSATFGRTWPKLVDLAAAMAPLAPEEDRRLARRVARSLSERLGAGARSKELRALLKG